MSSPGREHPSVQPAHRLSLPSSRGQVSPAQQELGPLCAQFGKNRSLCTGFITQTQVLCALLPRKILPLDDDGGRVFFSEVVLTSSMMKTSGRKPVFE